MALAQRLFFDINAKIGKTHKRDEMTPYQVETLLDDMDYYRVHGALVDNQEGCDYSYVAGNDALLQRVRKNDRLFAVAAVAPSYRFELPEGDAYLQSLVDAGVRAFTTKPGYFVHSLSPSTMDHLCAFMADKGLPLLLDAPQIEMGELEELLRAFPQLNVVLLTAKWAMNRRVYPLLEHYGNLYTDLSANQSIDLPMIFKRHFGVERLLYGSGYPQRMMGALKTMIAYSSVCEREKDMVAHGNALRLLRLPADTLKAYATPSRLDDLALTMEEGKPLSGVFILDSHAHMLDKEARVVNFTMVSDADPASMVRVMDRTGIDQAIVSPFEGLMTDGVSSDHTILQASQAYPGRFIPYACANPHFADDIGTVVARSHAAHHFPGLKPYWVYHGLPLTHDKYRDWFSYANEHRLFMLIHSGEDHIIPETRELALRYPDMTFLLGHSGISFRVARMNAALANELPNVVCELNFTNLTRGVVKFLVDTCGPDKVLFGTDMPLRDPAPQLGWIVYERLPREVKEQILSGNMKRILARCRW